MVLVTGGPSWEDGAPSWDDHGSIGSLWHLLDNHQDLGAGVLLSPLFDSRAGGLRPQPPLEPPPFGAKPPCESVIQILMASRIIQEAEEAEVEVC